MLCAILFLGSGMLTVNTPILIHKAPTLELSGIQSCQVVKLIYKASDSI